MISGLFINLFYKFMDCSYKSSILNLGYISLIPVKILFVYGSTFISSLVLLFKTHVKPIKSQTLLSLHFLSSLFCFILPFNNYKKSERAKTNK